MQSVNITFLIGMLLFSCRTAENQDNKNQAFEEKKSIFSSKIDRVYLAFKDTSKGTADAQMYSFPLDNQDGNGPVCAKYANGFDYQYDNAPAFKAEIADPNALPVLNIVGCYNEQYFDYKGDHATDKSGFIAVPYSYLPRQLFGVAHATYGWQSNTQQRKDSKVEFHCLNGEIKQQCLPFNERVRLADFDVLANGKCQIIGAVGNQGIADYIERGGAYARRNLKPQTAELVSLSFSAVSCAAVAAGPMVKAFTKGAEKVASLSTNSSKLAQAAAKVGVTALNLSSKAQKAAAAIGNVLKKIRIFKKTGAEILAKKFIGDPVVRGSFKVMAQAAIKAMAKDFLKDIAQEGIKYTVKAILGNIFANAATTADFCSALEISDKNCSILNSKAVTLTEETSAMQDFLNKLISSIPGNDALADDLNARAHSPQILAIVQQVGSELITVDEAIDLTLTGLAMVIPGAACLDTGFLLFKTLERTRKNANFQDLLASIKTSYDQTESCLMDSRLSGNSPELQEFRSLAHAIHRGQNSNGTPLEYWQMVTYQSFLIPQVAYAFNKIKQKETFKNGIFRLNSAIDEMKDALDAIEKEGPEMTLVTDLANIYSLAGELQDMPEAVKVGVEASDIYY